jgi:diadenosine tetraphosphatase ApaH/serine/threonine PP2A family protein phosphatase
VDEVRALRNDIARRVQDLVDELDPRPGGAYQFGGVLFVNCGSVGKPKDGDPRGAFAVLRPSEAGLQVRIERVSYDADAVAAEVRQAGLPGEFADKLLIAA